MGAYRSLRCSDVAGTGRTGDGSSEAAVGGEAAGAGDESLKKERICKTLQSFYGVS